MAEFATFAKFYSEEEAQPLITLLSEHGIACKVRRERNQLDSIIIGSPMEPMVAVDIPVDRFREASDLATDISGKLPDEDFTPEHLDIKWIVFGYALCVFPFAGLLAGITIMTSSKRLPDGRKVKMYDNHTRRHGKLMLAIAIIVAVIYTANKMFWLPVFDL